MNLNIAKLDWPLVVLALTLAPTSTFAQDRDCSASAQSTLAQIGGISFQAPANWSADVVDGSAAIGPAGRRGKHMGQDWFFCGVQFDRQPLSAGEQTALAIRRVHDDWLTSNPQVEQDGNLTPQTALSDGRTARLTFFRSRPGEVPQERIVWASIILPSEVLHLILTSPAGKFTELTAAFDRLLSSLKVATPPQSTQPSQFPESRQESRPDPRQNLVGTWHKTVTTSNMTNVEDLELRGDGTYTCRIHYVVIRGSRLEGGGVHNGTWRAIGTSVQLSGGPGIDGSGQWPSTVADLRQYQRVK